jgi:hypothetical protein
LVIGSQIQDELAVAPAVGCFGAPEIFTMTNATRHGNGRTRGTC